jgi:hypothetical protein
MFVNQGYLLFFSAFIDSTGFGGGFSSSRPTSLNFGSSSRRPSSAADNRLDCGATTSRTPEAAAAAEKPIRGILGEKVH